MLKLATLTFNPFGENTYVLFDETKQCVLVDVGCSTEQERQTLAAFIEKNDLRPMMAINTHGHVDHICGVEFVKRQWGIPFALHRNEKPIMEMAHCYADMGFDVDPIPTVEVDLAETETIPVGNSTLRILQTPGHSPGHVAIHVPDAELLLTGDLLFKESIGRTDLPGGSYPTQSGDSAGRRHPHLSGTRAGQYRGARSDVQPVHRRSVARRRKLQKRSNDA